MAKQKMCNYHVEFGKNEYFSNNSKKSETNVLLRMDNRILFYIY